MSLFINAALRVVRSEDSGLSCLSKKEKQQQQQLDCSACVMLVRGRLWCRHTRCAYCSAAEEQKAAVLLKQQRAVSLAIVITHIVGAQLLQ
jgi:hypothetical protein